MEGVVGEAGSGERHRKATGLESSMWVRERLEGLQVAALEVRIRLEVSTRFLIPYSALLKHVDRISYLRAIS